MGTRQIQYLQKMSILVKVSWGLTHAHGNYIDHGKGSLAAYVKFVSYTNTTFLLSMSGD